MPVLVIAGLVSSLAGVALEGRLTTFAALPALLILVPAHLSSAGALGGILSGRLSSQLLLGLAAPTTVPSRGARRDLWFVAGLSVPVFVLNGIGANVVARLLGEASPGLAQMIGVSLLSGALAMVVVMVIAYYGTIATVRLGIDPDTYGIPMVSSTVDLIGALTLVVAIATLGSSSCLLRASLRSCLRKCAGRLAARSGAVYRHGPVSTGLARLPCRTASSSSIAKA